MFSTQDYVQEKGKKSGRGRFEYLQALVTEFQDTDKQGFLLFFTNLRF